MKIFFEKIMVEISWEKKIGRTLHFGGRSQKNKFILQSSGSVFSVCGG